MPTRKSYRWKVDGNLQSNSSSFVFHTDYNSQGSYQLTLDIFDSGKKDKGSISLEWNIVVKDKDRPIIITDLIPADQDLNPIDQLVPVFQFQPMIQMGMVLIIVGNWTMILFQLPILIIL